MCKLEFVRESPKLWVKLCLVTQWCLTLCDPIDCSPPGSFVHGNSPDKNTRVGFHALLQGIFPTQGLNSGLPHWKQILYHLSHFRLLEWNCINGKGVHREGCGSCCLTGNCSRAFGGWLGTFISGQVRVFSNESVLCIKMAKVLEFQLQHQSFQWIFRTDFL